MHCGMKAVLPNGELLRTGMGALLNPKADTSKPLHEQEPNECWQLFNYGFGPYNDAFFSLKLRLVRHLRSLSLLVQMTNPIF